MDFQQQQQQQNKQLQSEEFKTQQELQSDLVLKIGEKSINRTFSESNMSINATAEALIQENKTKVAYENKVKNEQPVELKKQAPEENRYIGLEKCFAYKQSGDSDRMLALREAIKNYQNTKEESNNKVSELKSLKNIIKACKRYRFMRFSCFKRGKAKERLDQVVKLQNALKKFYYANDRYTSAGMTILNFDYMKSDAELERYKKIKGVKVDNNTEQVEEVEEGEKKKKTSRSRKK